MDLIFRHNGRLRQGSEFTQFQIGDPCHSILMMEPESREMILVSTDEIGRLCVRPLEPEESAELCKKHGLVIGVASMRKWRTGGRIRNPSVIDSLLEDEESMDQVG